MIIKVQLSLSQVRSLDAFLASDLNRYVTRTGEVPNSRVIAIIREMKTHGGEGSVFSEDLNYAYAMVYDVTVVVSDTIGTGAVPSPKTPVEFLRQLFAAMGKYAEAPVVP